jgi:hypothetical protein
MLITFYLEIFIIGGFWGTTNLLSNILVSYNSFLFADKSFN